MEIQWHIGEVLGNIEHFRQQITSKMFFFSQGNKLGANSLSEVLLIDFQVFQGFKNAGFKIGYIVAVHLGLTKLWCMCA